MGRSRIWSGLLVVVMLVPFGVSSAANPQADAAFFERLEGDMMTAFANGDRATLERLIGSEYQLTSATSTGGRINKSSYISGGLAQIKVRSFRFHDVAVQRFGDVAVVYCRLDWHSTWSGKEWSADFLMTDVWVKRGKQWQIVSRHSSYPATPQASGSR